ncbi:RagB/SusD family nutrient uptake outer membrane protein [Chondrinema litorale]|uniref:RagB/SusD family nutrient uptake outer membrane protein n=1 Tax=Chondrinema litorale TaxID=2994555 RepID=UPI0025430EA7|nr:RagB/SusD family nutrient uptake outer membrane protein [Chondrinema litorale]UZR94604.1 RagB/SusD family nutrient uptake outer membrane protein [Chondrinema litorale]
MKKLYISSLFAILMLFTTSCGEDFLESTPEQYIFEEDFLLSYTDFDVAIVGAYNQMQSASWYGRYLPLVADVMGEDVKQNSSANRASEWAEYNGSPQDFIPEDFWAILYEEINITNRIINSSFEPIESLTTDFDQIVGEAHAIRALAYFDLVRIFSQHYTYTPDASHNGVPIVLEFDSEAKPARNTVAEVYTQIISDFEQAISLMSITPSTSGTFSEAAVQALLSRVYLYMEDYEMTESYASQVISNGDYSLVSANDYPSQFFEGNSSEAILEIVYSTVDNPGSDHLGGMYKATGYGDYLPSEDLLNLMDDNDVRKTLFLEDEDLGGIYGNIRVNKYPSSGAEIGTDNIPVIRLSEVYLNRAEARAKSGDDTGAQEDLNIIRQRGNPEAAAVIVTGTALITEILNERRVELCFEGHRIFDITRNQLDMVRNDCTSSVCEVNYPNDRFILAIPIEETDVNINMIQNDGY